MTTFSDRLKELQEERNVTGRQIADATGIQHSGITSYLRGDSMPNARALIKLCKYFDVSADWLLGLSNFRKRKR